MLRTCPRNGVVGGGELGKVPELLSMTLGHDDGRNWIAAMMMHHGNQLSLGQGIQRPPFGKAVNAELTENFRGNGDRQRFFQPTSIPNGHANM